MGIVLPSGVIKAVSSVRGGVGVVHHKNTSTKELERFPAPEKVTIAMQQHIGAPCTPVVQVGDTVSVGQLVGDSEAFVSAPIHASISGKVASIGDIKLPNGNISKAITIESDGEMRLCEDIAPPKIATRKGFLKAIRDSGLVGLGGAGFPTHVKLAFPDDKEIDTLVVNAAECEPYITVDNRECIENSWNILSGIHALKEVFKFKNVIIAVENNKPEAINVLKSIAKSSMSDDGIKVMGLKSTYPQGAEKMMVLSATGRRVPPGKLPADVGCIVMNVQSVAFIARYLKNGKPLVSRSMTIDGSAIANPKNLRVPLGTNIGEIIDYCGGFKSEPFKIICGGPMMGLSLIGTDYPVLKQNNAILAFAKSETYKKERDCIRCGRCAAACPLSLMPLLVTQYADAKDIEKLKTSGAEICMECGSCAYSCPAGKPLVQHMKLAKSLLKEAQTK